MATLRCAAKFDPFLSLDCCPRPPPLRNPRKGRDQILPSGNSSKHPNTICKWGEEAILEFHLWEKSGASCMSPLVICLRAQWNTKRGLYERERGEAASTDAIHATVVNIDHSRRQRRPKGATVLRLRHYCAPVYTGYNNAHSHTPTLSM